MCYYWVTIVDRASDPNQKREESVAVNWTERRGIWTPSPGDQRGPFDVDYARTIHSASFRRLQGKTQILNLGDSDFYRTRLTHSLEVAQIAGGIALHLVKQYPRCAQYLPGLTLVQAVGFTHDLGHPPFGHGGEVALNYCMRDAGGFEGNAHTLRILSRLEHYSLRDGANLARRSLLGVLKYPARYSAVQNNALRPRLDEKATSIRVINRHDSIPPKCYFDSEGDVVDWILEPLTDSDRELFQRVTKKRNSHAKTQYRSLDSSIVDIADDVAYGVHDLEDAVALGLMPADVFRRCVTPEKCGPFLDTTKRGRHGRHRSDFYESFIKDLFANDGATRKGLIGELVNYFVTNTTVFEREQFTEPLVRYNANLSQEQRAFLDSLKDVVFGEVIESPSVQHLEFKGQQMVVSVFEALKSDPRSFLPADPYRQYEAARNPEQEDRAICDYVAGMTDGFLIKTYDRLFSPRMGSIFDRLSSHYSGRR